LRPRTGFSEAGIRIYEAMRERYQRAAGSIVVVDSRFDVRPSAALVARLATAGSVSEGAS
jgi:hypothetical protein